MPYFLILFQNYATYVLFLCWNMSTFSYLASLLHFKARIWAMKWMPNNQFNSFAGPTSFPIRLDNQGITHTCVCVCVCVCQPCEHWLSNNLQIFLYSTVTSLNGYQFSNTTDMVHVNLTEPDTLLTLVDFSNAFWLLRVSPLAILKKKYCDNRMTGMKLIVTSPRRHTKKRASPIPKPIVAIDCSNIPTRWPVACKQNRNGKWNQHISVTSTAVWASSMPKDFPLTQTFPQYFIVISLWGFQELKSGGEIKVKLYFNKVWFSISTFMSFFHVSFH